MMRFMHADSKLIFKGLLILLVLVAFGCGHRTSHGGKHHSKKTRYASTSAKNTSKTGKSGKTQHTRPSGLDEYFPHGEGTFGDLLEDDTLVREDPAFGSPSGKGPAQQDYWATRTKAEQLTAESGLQDVHFAFNSSRLTDQAKTILALNAEWLKDHPHADVTIEGHCDDRGTSAYNFILGEKRALRARNYLISLGVKDHQLQIMSYGKDNPACWEPTESCYQKNRRAHLVLGVNLAATAMRENIERQW